MANNRRGRSQILRGATMKPISLIRRELHAFCELAQRRGYRIAHVPGFAKLDRKCCPLGAVEVTINVQCGDDCWASLGARLMGGHENVRAFYRGFDGYLHCNTTHPLYLLGREFREHYDPR
jgi:hypothetical protein